jgi:hypothetical protein
MKPGLDDGLMFFPPALQSHVKKVDETRVRLSDKERQERHDQLQRTLALLVHACGCNSISCASNSCRKVYADQEDILLSPRKFLSQFFHNLNTFPPRSLRSSSCWSTGRPAPSRCMAVARIARRLGACLICMPRAAQGTIAPCHCAVNSRRCGDDRQPGRRTSGGLPTSRCCGLSRLGRVLGRSALLTPQ